MAIVLKNKKNQLINETLHKLKVYEKKIKLDQIEFYNYLKGKRVILVGPSTSVQNCKIDGMNLGEYIESFDVVVRLNKALTMKGNKNYYGVRTDVLYNNMCFYERGMEFMTKTEFIKKKGVKYLVSAYPEIDPFKKDIQEYIRFNRGKIPLIIPSLTNYMNLCNHLTGSRPYTGMCAIYDLLSYPIASLDVYGVDFYLTGGYNRTYKTIYSADKWAKNSYHDAGIHHRFLRHFLPSEPRLIYDKRILPKLFINEFEELKRYNKLSEHINLFYNTNYFTNILNKFEKIFLIDSSISSNKLNKNKNYNNDLIIKFFNIDEKINQIRYLNCILLSQYSIDQSTLSVFKNNYLLFCPDHPNNNHSINTSILDELHQFGSIELLVLILLKLVDAGKVYIYSETIKNKGWLGFLGVIKWLNII